MEILRYQRDGYLEMFFEGRLDAYWAQHLADSVGDAMRQGNHAVRLNLSKANYLSSAGIGTLVQIYKQFAAVNGSFSVVEPSPQVKKIIEMVGLRDMLSVAAPSAATPAAAGRYLVFECAPGAKMTCRIAGDPRRLAAAGFAEADCHNIPIGANGIALGLGALGEGFVNCHERFGEFLAVAGAAAYQPTDGTNYPDYMVSSGSFLPNVTALYGIRCEGAFSKLMRFEEALPLSQLVEKCLEVAGAPTVAVAMIAESGGLMGATLKKPPVNGGSVFAFPEVQTWLSFTPDLCHSHNLVLLVGVASSSTPEKLTPLLRPMSKGSSIAGHFHAAAFSYRPLQKGRLELQAAVKGLFDAGGLQAVLHVLGDDRERGGESELLRGACWVSPIAEAIA